MYGRYWVVKLRTMVCNGCEVPSYIFAQASVMMLSTWCGVCCVSPCVLACGGAWVLQGLDGLGLGWAKVGGNVLIALGALEVLLPGLLLLVLCFLLLVSHLLLHVLFTSLQLHAKCSPSGGGVGQVLNDLLLLDVVGVCVLQEGLQLLQHVGLGQLPPVTVTSPLLWLLLVGVGARLLVCALGTSST